MKIGFFDSGLGGLTILKAVAAELPQYDYLFYGDTKNLPYGDKSEEEIYKLTKAAVAELFERGCLIVIIACNTASAQTMRKLQDTYLVDNYPDRRILGVIIPAVEELIEQKQQSTILLATKRTIESGKYELELNKRGSDIVVYGVATPELVPLIEMNDMTTAEKVAVEKIETKRGEVGEVDSVVLGCTHYTKLKESLRKHFGSKFQILSQDEIIPDKIKWYLEAHPELESRLTKEGTREIILTEHRGDYDQIAAELLGSSFIAE